MWLHRKSFQHGVVGVVGECIRFNCLTTPKYKITLRINRVTKTIHLLSLSELLTIFP